MLYDIMTNLTSIRTIDSNVSTAVDFGRKIVINSIVFDNYSSFTQCVVEYYCNGVKYGTIKDFDDVNIMADKLVVSYYSSDLIPNLKIFTELSLEDVMDDELYKELMINFNKYGMDDKYNNTDVGEFFMNYLSTQ